MLVCKMYFSVIYFVICFHVQPNKNLDMSINASNNFNLNITWSVGSTGNVCSFCIRHICVFSFLPYLLHTCGCYSNTFVTQRRLHYPLLCYFFNHVFVTSLFLNVTLTFSFLLNSSPLLVDLHALLN